MARATKFTQYDHLEFPEYCFQPYPKALKPPDKDRRIVEARAELKAASLIEDKNQRESAMELARKNVETAFHAHVIVNSAEEEKAQLAKWAVETKAKV